MIYKSRCKSRKLYVNIIISLIGAIALLAAGLTTFGQVRSSSEEEYKFGSIDFAGQYIATLTDADFTADNEKYPRALQPTADKLSIIPLPLNGYKRPSAQINVSNAVRSSTFPMATSPDGKTIFIIETLGDANTSNTSQMPGNKLSAIDLSDLGDPKVTDQIQLDYNAKSVNINPNGDLLAIPTKTDQEITFVPLQNNQFGTPKSFPLTDIQADSRQGSEVTYIEWHPDGDYIAAIIPARNQVIFYKVQRNGQDIKLLAWGKPIEVRNPFSGKFTPDGRFFITNNQCFFNTHRQPNNKRFTQEQPKGTLSVIQLANERNVLSNTKHQIVSTVVADVCQQGIAINANGDLIATANKLVTFDSEDIEYLSKDFSISLFKLDLQTGQLVKVASSRVEGALAKGIHFDTSGDYLAITVSEYFKPKKPGAIEIWRVQRRSDKFALERTNYIIDVAKGTYAVIVW
jgi:6-phosphogluconolactonase (cycloisomerase 2 family)